LVIPFSEVRRRYSKFRQNPTNYMPLSKFLDDSDFSTFHAYWSRRRGARTMPRRADINPKDIVSALPLVFIVGICQPLRFQFRLVGSAICARWHDDFTGKWLDELDYDGEREAVLAQYASVAQIGAPRADEVEFVNGEGRYLHYRRMLLPLGEEDQMPNMLIGIQKVVGIDGYGTDLPKWM
jgi:hypothetical protein